MQTADAEVAAPSDGGAAATGDTEWEGELNTAGIEARELLEWTNLKEAGLRFLKQIGE
jgi:hypothetical protein